MLQIIPQAKALGDVLVVGLIPDSEILRCKGPPVMNEAERFTMVNSVKWVDEVLTGAQISCWSKRGSALCACAKICCMQLHL